MNKNNNSLGAIAGVAIIIVAVMVAGLYFGSNGKLFSVGVQTGTGATTQTATLTSSGGVCPVTPTNGYPKVALAGTYVDPTNNSNVAQPSVAVSVYQVGNPKAIVVTTTNAISGYAYTNGTVTCGSTLYAVFGDNTNYYDIQTQNFNVNSSITYIVNSHLLKMANIQTPTYSNGIVSGASSITYPDPQGNGATLTTASVRLAAGAGQYGVGAIAVDPTFNATAYQSIQVVGGIQTSVTVVPSSANVPTGFIQTPYLVPALSWYNSTTLSFIIKTGTLSPNTVIDNPVNIFVNDQVNFLANGQLTPSFVNPVTRADLGQGFTSQNAVINVYK